LIRLDSCVPCERNLSSQNEISSECKISAIDSASFVLLVGLCELVRLARGREMDVNFDLNLQAGERWFVAQTLSQRENMAGFHLEAQGFRIFMPRFRKTVRHARKLREAIAPIFPGYVFVVLDLERDRWRSINGTFGVARLVTAQSRPTSVPTGVVEALVASVDESGLVRFDDDIRPGQPVSVLAGPFAKSFGVLSRLDGNGRVRVLLAIMGGLVSVAMDRADLTAA
jgi:transcription antitermination factor NusG